jgi:hypothetical protein
VESGEVKTSGPALSPDAVKASPPQPRRVWLAGILFFYTLCIFVPWTLSPPPDDLDASWVAALHWAHVHGIDFGHDLIFTYGPWGFAMLRYLPATFGAVVGVWAFLSLAFFCAAWRIFGKIPSWKSGAVLLAIFITMAGAPIRQFQDVRLAAICWLLLPLYFYFDDSSWDWVKILIVVGMAWVGLIKFSYVAIGLAALAAVSVDQMRRRKIPSYLVIYVAAYVGLWLLAGQHLSSLGAYLSHSLTIASGYTEGEQLFSPSESTDVLSFLAVSMLVLVLAGMMHPWHRYRSEKSLRRVIDETLVAAPGHAGPVEHAKSWIAAGGIVGVLFLLFKAGYVRHDTHEMITTGSLSLMMLAIGATVWRRVEEPVAKIVIVVACLGGWGLACHSEYSSIRPIAPVQAMAGWAEVPGSIGTAIDWMTGGSEIRAEFAGQRTAIPEETARQISGTVDSYMTGQKALVDNDLDYSPRPIIQSYVAYNSELARLNAEFLTTARAPQTILFGLETIDGHYPSQDDALSIPELLSRYDLKDASGPRLLLRRADQPRGYSLIPLEKRSGIVAHMVDVPVTDDPVWVALHLQLTPLGRLMRAVYKLPKVGLLTVTPSGREIRSALLREEADSGFLLSPYVPDRVALGMLYSPRWKSVLGKERIVQMGIGFDDDSADMYYEGEYQIEFYALHYPQTDISAVPGIADYENIMATADLADGGVLHSDDTISLTSEDTGKVVLRAPAKSEIYLPFPTGAKKIYFGFGMLNGSFSEDPKTDGVEFEVITVDRNLKAIDGWRERLDPANNPADRGVHKGELDRPSSTAVGVVLQTLPGPQHIKSDSYWTDVQFK